MSDARIPAKLDLGRTVQSTLYTPIDNLRNYNSGKDLEFMNPLNMPTIMGYVIPEFQRPLVWSEAQNISFIESLWLGIPVGTYTINIDLSYGKGNPKTRNILVDGQQRMNALERYLTNEFAVFGYTYCYLTVAEKRRFGSIHWSSFESSSDDEEYIKSYYNKMNFSGTSHTGEQKA